MSGGSMDYLSYRVEEAAFREDTLERRAFRAHLLLVAAALHEIEWVDSGDSSPGDWDTPAILRCISRSDVLMEATRAAEAAREDLDRAIRQAREELR